MAPGAPQAVGRNAEFRVLLALMAYGIPAVAEPADASKPRADRPARLSADDWAQAALDLIAEQGVAAVAVEPLARRLGVTKGSFYWHFRDRSELLQALLDRWAHERTGEVLTLALGTTSDPRERLRRILVLGREVAPLDRAMRLWAQHDPSAAEAVRHADRTLLSHLAGCLAALGFPEADARRRALLMLRTWVGGYLVPSPDAPSEEGASGAEGESSAADPEELLDLFLHLP